MALKGMIGWAKANVLVLAVISVFLVFLLASTSFAGVGDPTVSATTNPTNNTNITTGFTVVNITMNATNGTESGDWIKNCTLEFNNESGNLNYTMTVTNVSAGADAAYCTYNLTTLSDTKNGDKLNWSVYANDSANNVTHTGLYYFIADNTTPTVSSLSLNITNTTDLYANAINLTTNVTTNNPQSCVFRVYYETTSYTDVEGDANNTWTLNSTANITGAFTGSHDGTYQNCTANVTATTLGDMVPYENGPIRIECWAKGANAVEGKSANNITIIYNNIPGSAWSLLGWTEATTTAEQFGWNVTAGNFSYVSIFNNTWDNKSFVTYRSYYTGNNATSLAVNANDSGGGGVFVYPATSNGWELLRFNTTLTASLTEIELYGSTRIVNESFDNGTWFDDSNTTVYMFSRSDVNTSYTVAAFNATNHSDDFTISANATGANITENSTINVTIEYAINSKTPWNVVSIPQTNTTKNIALQFANITHVCYYNNTPNSADDAYFACYKKGWSPSPYENVTVHIGEAVWVLMNTTFNSGAITINNTVSQGIKYTKTINQTWNRHVSA